MSYALPSAGDPADVSVDAHAHAAERRVVAAYTPVDRRAGFAAVLALDDILGGIVRTTSEPIVGQMRLTWWHEALEALDHGAASVGHPVLDALASDVVPRGISGAMLAATIDGWEALLAQDTLDMPMFARARGGTVFAALARLLGGPVDAAVTRAGEGWALADFATHVRDPTQAAMARTMATDALDEAFRDSWPRPLRPLGMLALLARADVVTPSSRPGSPRRLARLLLHRISGR